MATTITAMTPTYTTTRDSPSTAPVVGQVPGVCGQHSRQQICEVCMTSVQTDRTMGAMVSESLGLRSVGRTAGKTLPMMRSQVRILSGALL